MRLTFLGTGSAMPTGHRAQSGLLVEAGDRSLLVDCGSGVLGQLARTATGYESVDAVLLTHHHLDHCSDLLPLVKARWLAGAGDLPIAGPSGTADLVDGLFEVHAYMQDRIETPVTEVGPSAFSFAGFDVAAVETIHSMYGLAYRFAGDGDDAADLAYSGDTEASEAVADLADGASVLVHDGSFPDDVDVSNHPTPSQLGAVLAGHDYGTVYLTHLYPHTEGRHQEMVASIGEHYDGDVRFASDGLSVTI